MASRSFDRGSRSELIGEVRRVVELFGFMKRERTLKEQRFIDDNHREQIAIEEGRPEKDVSPFAQAKPFSGSSRRRLLSRYPEAIC